MHINSIKVKLNHFNYNLWIGCGVKRGSAMGIKFKLFLNSYIYIKLVG